MQESQEKQDSLKTYLESKINQSNIINIIDIIDDNISFNDRAVNTSYFSKEVYEQWSLFCKVHPKYSKAELTEKVLIYAMMNLSNKYALIELNVPEKSVEQHTIEDRMLEVICTGDLKTFIGEVINLRKQGVTIHQDKLNKLSDIIKKCQKINNRSTRLNELIEEAIDLVE